MRFSPGNAQHIGARDEQQDSFGFSDPSDPSFISHAGIAAVVADGMGGLANGSAASSTAVKVFLSAYESKGPAEPIPEALLRSLREANRAVAGLSRRPDMKDLGTTLAAVVMHEDWLYWVSAGDSRVYFYRHGRLIRLTTDHVYANDLDEEVGRGRITREQAMSHPERDALTSYLGLETLPRIDRSVKAFPVNPGDSVLICTDGLYRSLSDEEIAATLQKDARRACDSLVERALSKQNTHQDNITVIALKCEKDKWLPDVLRSPLTVAAVAIFAVAAFLLLRLWFAPQILQFAVDRSSVKAGGTAILRWTVDRGNLLITPGVGLLESCSGTRAVTPARNTSYTLIAENLFGTTSKTVPVTVLPPDQPNPPAPPAGAAGNPTGSVEVSPAQKSPLRVVTFAAEKNAIRAGGNAVLKWKVAGQPAWVKIDKRIGTVKPTGSLRVSPKATTTYTLTAGGPQVPQASASVKIEVLQPPKIDSFQAVNDGQGWKLRWQVSGADHQGTTISIEPGIGRVSAASPGDGFAIPAPVEREYTLTAEGPGGTASKIIAVPAPPSDGQP